MSNNLKSLLATRRPPVVPSLSNLKSGQPRNRLGRRDYTPLSWREYWDKNEEVMLENGDVFKVYQRGSTGPVLLLLHGGGYSALTWSLFATSITSMVECQVVAFDQRGHGETRTSNDTDLSAETLANDVRLVVDAVYGETRPPIVIMGHSMGGAIAVHTSAQPLVSGLAGLIVIDVVEGTALDALTSMQSFLRGRPKKFLSLQTAIEFSVRSGQTRNLEAAKVSMPGQVKNARTNKCGTLDVEAQDLTNAVENVSLESVTRDDVIKEEEEELSNTEESNQQFVKPLNSEYTSEYHWRINLSDTERYWQGWFKGLSEKFLTCQPAKLLLLAGIDRLDTDLTVGQMQGKFQMQVLPQCGHAVHEDVPDRVAEVLATFLLRQKLTTAINDFQRSFPAC